MTEENLKLEKKEEIKNISKREDSSKSPEISLKVFKEQQFAAKHAQFQISKLKGIVLSRVPVFGAGMVRSPLNKVI